MNYVAEWLGSRAMEVVVLRSHSKIFLIYHTHTHTHICAEFSVAGVLVYTVSGKQNHK